MVVAQNDLVAPDSGFGEHASDLIPAADEGPIPFHDDEAALSDDLASESPATDEGQPAVDLDSLPQEARDLLEQGIRQQLQADFDNRFREFQSRKDREIADRDSQIQEMTAVIRLAQQWIDRTFKQVAQGEYQPTGFEGLQFEKAIREAISHSRAQKRQAQTSMSAWEQESRQRMQAELEQMSRDDKGNLIVDLTQDAELNALADKFYDAARRGDVAENERLYRQHVRLAAEKRAAAIAAAQAKRRSPAQQARDRQQARGPQAVARGGAPAGPLDFKAALASARAQAEQQGITNYNDIFLLAKQIQSQSTT